jgi:NADH-quinone oxidoreductase subunit I
MNIDPREVWRGFWSLISGMRITLRQFFKPSVTLQYPHQVPTIPKRYRGHIELVRDPATGKAVCIACKLCEKACPSECIIVEGAKVEGNPRKQATEFKLDFTKCSLCGSCIEACKSEAIRYSRDYNLASTNKDEFLYDLLKRVEVEKR